jgi:hypothetical protein
MPALKSFERLVIASVFLSLLGLAASASAHADCTRNYSLPDHSGETKINSIRLVNGAWQVGAESSSDQWTLLSCKPDLLTDFYDPFHQEAQEEQGQAHVGRTASFIFYPSAKVPEGVQFSAEPQDLFGANRIEITLIGTGQVFLDRSAYEQFKTKINGLDVEIDSEPANPAKDSALKTLEIFTRLFPHHSAAMAKSDIGRVQVVLARNSTENFQPESLRANGKHHPQYLWSVLFSQDGSDTLSHSFHEVGGLFRALHNQYSQGQTWMASYDQMEKAAGSPAERLDQRCLNAERAVWSLQDTVKQNGGDASHNIETYIEDGGKAGWSVYAWGSAYYWEKINTRLEELKLPTVYDLIDSTPVAYGDAQLTTNAESRSKDLDQLIAAYKVLSPKHAKVFERLANRYFRKKSLKQLIHETEREVAQLGCKSE